MSDIFGYGELLNVVLNVESIVIKRRETQRNKRRRAKTPDYDKKRDRIKNIVLRKKLEKLAETHTIV
jgi:hypothetical protein